MAGQMPVVVVSYSLQTVVVTPPERKLSSCCHHQDSSMRCLWPLFCSLPLRVALLIARMKRRFSKQPRHVGALRRDPWPAARCRQEDFFRSNDDEYKKARFLSKSHHHYSPRAAKLPQVRRTNGFPTAAGCVTSPWRPPSGGEERGHSELVITANRLTD